MIRRCLIDASTTYFSSHFSVHKLRVAHRFRRRSISKPRQLVYPLRPEIHPNLTRATEASGQGVQRHGREIRTAAFRIYRERKRVALGNAVFGEAHETESRFFFFLGILFFFPNHVFGVLFLWCQSGCGVVWIGSTKACSFLFLLHTRVLTGGGRFCFFVV